MAELTGVSRGEPLNTVQQSGERTRLECGLLGLAHLRRRDHLHRAGDLGRAGDRLNASAKFTWTEHISPCCSHFQVCVNSSAEAFNSAFNASLSSFSLPILASN